MDDFEKTMYTRNQEIILGDPNVEAFVERAKHQGYMDALGGVDGVPFFEDTTTMSWEQRILYDDRTAEEAIKRAYYMGREFGGEIAEI